MSSNQSNKRHAAMQKAPQSRSQAQKGQKAQKPVMTPSSIMGRRFAKVDFYEAILKFFHLILPQIENGVNMFKKEGGIKKIIPIKLLTTLHKTYGGQEIKVCDVVFGFGHVIDHDKLKDIASKMGISYETFCDLIQKKRKGAWWQHIFSAKPAECEAYLDLGWLHYMVEQSDAIRDICESLEETYKINENGMVRFITPFEFLQQIALKKMGVVLGNKTNLIRKDNELILYDAHFQILRIYSPTIFEENIVDLITYIVPYNGECDMTMRDGLYVNVPKRVIMIDPSMESPSTKGEKFLLLDPKKAQKYEREILEKKEIPEHEDIPLNLLCYDTSDTSTDGFLRRCTEIANEIKNAIELKKKAQRIKQLHNEDRATEPDPAREGAFRLIPYAVPLGYFTKLPDTDVYGASTADNGYRAESLSYYDPLTGEHYCHFDKPVFDPILYFLREHRYQASYTFYTSKLDGFKCVSPEDIDSCFKRKEELQKQTAPKAAPAPAVTAWKKAPAPVPAPVPVPAAKPETKSNAKPETKPKPQRPRRNGQRDQQSQ